MSIQFDKLPKEKPSQNATMSSGRYLVKVTKAEMVARTDDTPYLCITFANKDKETFRENFFDNPKPFNMYKINRLLKATGIILEGEGNLSDIAKLIVGKKAIVDITVNDRGYANLDFTDKKEGIYSTDEVIIGEVDTEPDTKPELDEDVTEAIASDDEDF